MKKILGICLLALSASHLNAMQHTKDLGDKRGLVSAVQGNSSCAGTEERGRSQRNEAGFVVAMVYLETPCGNKLPEELGRFYSAKKGKETVNQFNFCP